MFAAKQNTKRTVAVTSVFEVELRRGLEPCLWCMDLGLISGLFGLGGRRVSRDPGIWDGPMYGMLLVRVLKGASRKWIKYDQIRTHHFLKNNNSLKSHVLGTPGGLLEHGLLEIGDADLCDVQKLGANVAKVTNGKKSKAKDLPGRAAHRSFGKIYQHGMGWWDAGMVGLWGSSLQSYTPEV